MCHVYTARPREARGITHGDKGPSPYRHVSRRPGHPCTVPGPVTGTDGTLRAVPRPQVASERASSVVARAISVSSSAISRPSSPRRARTAWRAARSHTTGFSRRFSSFG
jgi:hypothetical protein